MKYLCKIILLLLLQIVLYSTVKSQHSYQWSPERKLTEGYYDSNPDYIRDKFNISFNNNTFETLIFERKNSENDSVSRICVVNIDTSGITGNTVYISSGDFNDKNPVICIGDYYNHSIYKHAFAVWESQRDSLIYIVGCYFNINTGWQSPFIIDSSAQCHNPDVASIDSLNYSVVYESSNDIIYKEVNADTGIINYEYNLTDGEMSVCKTPKILENIFNIKKQVTYEKQNTDSTFHLYKRNLNFGNIWSNPEIVYGVGDVRNAGFMTTYVDEIPLFESNQSGYWNIYSLHDNSLITINDFNDSADNTSLQRFFNNLITLDGYIYSDAIAYKENYSGINRLILNSTYASQKDTVIISGDPDKTSMTMSNGIYFQNYDFLIWVIYNKDSSGRSSLYGKSVIVRNTGISETGNILLDRYSLSQNYPNPFNPKTVINYELRVTSDLVSIKVFDVLGNEVSTLVNEKQTPGSYTVTFDGSNFPSGVYFYKLEAGDFAETKRMVLLK